MDELDAGMFFSLRAELMALMLDVSCPGVLSQISIDFFHFLEVPGTHAIYS